MFVLENTIYVLKDELVISVKFYRLWRDSQFRSEQIQKSLFVRVEKIRKNAIWINLADAPIKATY
jgi:hypothetical protein